MKFLTWAELHDRGVLPSRQHTRRLIARGIVPKPYRLGDPERGRLMWLEADIEAYVAKKAAERELPRPRATVPDGAAEQKVVPLRRRRGRPAKQPRVDFYAARQRLWDALARRKAPPETC
jgi:predicted DNA-binding transcriptional regulator AlpA